MALSRLSVVDVNLCVGCQCCLFACARRFGDAGVTRSSIHVRSAGGIERGFIVIVCRACQDAACAKVCPTNALTLRPGGGVILNQRRCIGCKNCVDACTIGAVLWDAEIDKPSICVHCGFCTNFCPYGVLKIEPTESVKVDR